MLTNFVLNYEKKSILKNLFSDYYTNGRFNCIFEFEKDEWRIDSITSKKRGFGSKNTNI